MHFLPDDPLTCHQPAALRGAEQPGAIASRLQVALLLSSSSSSSLMSITMSITVLITVLITDYCVDYRVRST